MAESGVIFIYERHKKLKQNISGVQFDQIRTAIRLILLYTKSRKWNNINESEKEYLARLILLHSKLEAGKNPNIINKFNNYKTPIAFADSLVRGMAKIYTVGYIKNLGSNIEHFKTILNGLNIDTTLESSKPQKSSSSSQPSSSSRSDIIKIFHTSNTIKISFFEFFKFFQLL